MEVISIFKNLIGNIFHKTDINMEFVGQRIKQKRKESKCNQRDFAEKIGIDPSQYSKIENGKLMPTLSQIMDISSILNISTDWLLKGFKDENKYIAEPVPSYLKTKEPVLDRQQIPLYDFEAAASIVSLFRDKNQQLPVDYIQIPHLAKSDGAIYVTGDSMYPLLKSGDIIIYKEINNHPDSIYWGEMYLVSVEIDGDEMTTVKWIHKSDLGLEHIKLVSQNQHHQPKDVHISNIKALALIKASIRFNSMS